VGLFREKKNTSVKVVAHWPKRNPLILPGFSGQKKIQDVNGSMPLNNTQ